VEDKKRRRKRSWKRRKKRRKRRTIDSTCIFGLLLKQACSQTATIYKHIKQKQVQIKGLQLKLNN